MSETARCWAFIEDRHRSFGPRSGPSLLRSFPSGPDVSNSSPIPVRQGPAPIRRRPDTAGRGTPETGNAALNKDRDDLHERSRAA